MKRPIVFVDCDGVLADFTQVYLDWVRESKYARIPAFTKEEITQFDIGKAFGFPDNVWKEFSDWLNKNPHKLDFEVLGDARYALGVLRSFCDVVCVTSPLTGCDLWVPRRNVWLEKKLGFSKDDIFHGSRKELLCGHVLVDDKVENVLRWADENKGGMGLLFDQPWNRMRVEFPLNAMKVFDWSGVIQTAKGFL